MCNKDFNDFANHDKVMAEYERLREEGQIAFCTFHQSMDYEDFVEGLKPEVKGEGVEYKVVIAPKMTWLTRDWLGFDSVSDMKGFTLNITSYGTITKVA